MIPATIASPDRLVLTAPMALRFRDPWGQQVAWSRFRVVARHPLRPGKEWSLVPGPSGGFLLHDLPAVLSANYPSVGDDLPPATTTRDSRWMVRVQDPLGQFLPMDFAVTVPTAGFVRISKDPTDPALEGTGLGMFPSSMRPYPASWAVVRANLVSASDLQPLAWARMVVYQGSTALGAGLSNASGEVLASFPCPPPPPVPLDPHEAASYDPKAWTCTARVFHDVALQESEIPPQSVIAGSPEVQPLESLAPDTPMGPWTLRAGVTRILSTHSKSSLHVAA